MERAKGSTAKGQGTTPPYVAFKTFKTFLEDLRSHNIPSRIDASVMQRVSGTVRNQLVTALRFLALIDAEDRPTPALRTLVDAYGSDAWPSTLSAILRDAYPSIFTLGLDSVSPAHLVDGFKPLASSDDVRRKCLVFFVQAARDAEITVSKRVLDQMKRGSGLAPRRKREAPREARPENGTGVNGSQEPPPSSGNKPPLGVTPSAPEKSVYQVLLDVWKPGEMPEEVDEAVVTLMRWLKEEERKQGKPAAS